MYIFDMRLGALLPHAFVILLYNPCDILISKRGVLEHEKVSRGRVNSW